MTEKELQIWKKIYLVAMAIAELEPWSHFREEDTFACILQDQKTALFFSFLQKSSGQSGIACYVGDANYAAARKRLFGPNPKKEPVFFLQTALIGLWGDREEVSPAGRSILKELGFKCRGRGAWLHFDSYLPGRFPAPLSEEQASLLCAGLGPLYAMVEAVVVKGYHVGFDQGELLLWTSLQKEQFFRVDSLDLPFADTPAYSTFLVEEDDVVRRLRDTPSRAYSVELDWSVLDAPMRNGRKKFYPHFLIGVDSASSYIYCTKLINPYEDKCSILLNTLGTLVEEHGKPKKLYLSDPELEACLADFCQKIELPLVMKKNLPQTTWARKTFQRLAFHQ